MMQWDLLDLQFEKGMVVKRSSPLQKYVKTKRKEFLFVINYNFRLPDVNFIIFKKTYPHFIQILSYKKLLAQKFNFTRIRRGKNLKKILAPSLNSKLINAMSTMKA